MVSRLPTRTQAPIDRNAAQLRIAKMREAADRRRLELTAKARFDNVPSRLRFALERLEKSNVNRDEVDRVRQTIDSLKDEDYESGAAGVFATNLSSYAYNAWRGTRTWATGQGGRFRLPSAKDIGVATLEAAQTPIEEAVLQPFYAAQRAMLKGASLRKQLHTGVSALPGLSTFASPQERSWIEQTNSWQERAALTEAGELASIGELATGRGQDRLKPALRKNMPGWAEGNNFLPDQLSGVIDGGVQVILDPLNPLMGGATRLGRVGRILRTPARRTAYLAENSVGRALLDTATEMAVRSPNIRSLRRSVRDLPTEVAERVVAAGETSGRAGVRAVLAEAFAMGEWDPLIRLRNQAQIRAGSRTTPGRSAVRTSDPLAETLRRLGRGDTPQAIKVNSNNVDAVLASTNKAGLDRLGTTELDFYNTVVAPGVARMGVVARARRLVELGKTTDNGTLADIIAELKGDLIRARKDAGKMSALADRVRRVEIAAALLAQGGKAADQAAVGLSHGLRSAPRTGTQVLKQARRNVGLGRREKRRYAPTTEVVQEPVATPSPSSPRLSTEPPSATPIESFTDEEVLAQLRIYGDGPEFEHLKPAKGIDDFVLRRDGKTVAKLRVSPLGITVLVDPAYRRKGLATELYRRAEAAGIDIEAISGTANMTPEGRAFFQGRRTKATASTASSSRRTRLAGIEVFHGTHGEMGHADSAFTGIHVGSEAAARHRLASIDDFYETVPGAERPSWMRPGRVERYTLTGKVYGLDSPVTEAQAEVLAARADIRDQFSAIAYINDAEDAGSVSYMVLDRSALVSAAAPAKATLRATSALEEAITSGAPIRFAHAREAASLPWKDFKVRVAGRVGSGVSEALARREHRALLEGLLDAGILPAWRAVQPYADLRARYRTAKAAGAFDLTTTTMGAKVGAAFARKVEAAFERALTGLMGLPSDPADLARYLRARVESHVTDSGLKAKLLDELAAAADEGDSALRRLGRQVEATLDDKRLLAEAERLSANEARRLAQAAGTATRPGLLRRAATAPVLAMAEPAPPRSVNFQGGPNEAINRARRVESADRWMSALGLDDFTKGQLAHTFENVASEADLYGAVRNALTVVARRYGVDEKVLHDILAESHRRNRERLGFAVGDDGKLVGKIQTGSQLIEEIPLPDPADIRRTVMDLRALRGDRGPVLTAGLRKGGRALSGSRPTQMTLGAAAGALTAEGDAGDRFKGALVGAGAGAIGLQNIHRLWKFSVVTNVPTIAVGAVAGGLAEGPTGALVGATIGVLAPARYIVRVALIEEKMRTYLSHGFTPSQFIPGVSKWVRNRGIPVNLRFRAHDAVRAGNTFGPHLSNKFLTSVDSAWEVVVAKSARFVDAWWRIVNYQIHVETDVLADIFVRERAGLLSRSDADRAARSFLTTDGGRLHLRRLRAGTGGPKNADEALARYREFIEEHMTPSMADARLRGEVGRDLLKQEKRLGRAPDAVHAQRTWVMPKSAKDLFSTVQQMTAKAVLGGPTNRFNRVPMAEHIYNKELNRLLRNGVDPARAQSIAEEMAVERTNAVMFQIEDESRFAKKVDFVFPFQQPREELFRVWAKLIVANPVKAAKVGRLAALALNNGQDNGMFRKDPYGEWVMTIPGSAYLSDVLFNSQFGDGYDARLRDLLFVGQGAFNMGFIPSPGGPFWSVFSRSYFERNPDAWAWFGEHPFLKQLIFPYDPSGKLLRNEPNRLWQAFTGGTPPWEFAGDEMQRNEAEKWKNEIAYQLRREHLEKHPNDLDWRPSEDEVREATKQFFKSWAFFGAVFPAGPRPINPSRDEAYAVREAYVERYGEKNWFRHAVRDHPGLAPYFYGQWEYVGPDDFEHWKNREKYADDKFVNAMFSQRSWQDILAQMDESRRISKAHNERREASRHPDRLVREALLMEWRKKNPDLAADYRDDYFRDKELATILTTYPKSQRDAAIDRWRREYDVTPAEYKRLKRSVVKDFEVSPWREARDTEDVIADVRSSLRLGTSETVAVAKLQPAEQVRYWQGKLMEFTYERMAEDPQKVLDRYWNLKNRIRDVYKDHPELAASDREESVFERSVAKWQGDAAKAISDLYSEATRVRAAMDRAAQAKQWKTYYALKDKRTAIYDQIRVIRNQQYAGQPWMRDAMDELRAVWMYEPASTTAAEMEDIYARAAEVAGFRFVGSREMQTYIAMPNNVKQAYIDDLISQLETPSGQKGKLFWAWLTDFQRDLLRRNLPTEMVESWEGEKPGAGGASGRGGFRRGGGGGATGELGYAYAMFEQYNQRGNRQAPAAYKAYLELPNNPVVRADFLKKHPEVAEWIRLGPMANMPEVVRYIVADIMIRNGKWEGELRTMEEITDLAFAREQMKRWSRRGEGATAPAAYDFWLHMPSGPEKAAYMQAHPEVKEWLQLGPMANMPDDYKEVVRDIMIRYGEWTERQDPLGQTIAQFYATPGYARDAFMEQHPELKEYWAALRSPEENRMFVLSDRYFSIPDPAARKTFLAAHPELQQWFVEQRSRRYERFLNKVAQYMGANPEMFQQYLERQEDILAELLRNFAEPNLVREARLGAGEQTARSEGGRQRKTA